VLSVTFCGVSVYSNQPWFISPQDYIDNSTWYTVTIPLAEFGIISNPPGVPVDYIYFAPAQGFLNELYFDNITFVALHGPTLSSRSTLPVVYSPPTLTFSQSVAGVESCTDNCGSETGTTTGQVKSGGNSGMDAGIAIGVIFGVLLLAAIIVGAIFLYKRHRNSMSAVGSVDKNYNIHL